MPVKGLRHLKGDDSIQGAAEIENVSGIFEASYLMPKQPKCPNKCEQASNMTLLKSGSDEGDS